jgi:DNA-binding MarR family transcriptional regulator
MLNNSVMNKLLQETKDYLQEVLGLVKGSVKGSVEGRDDCGELWPEAGKLPFYLQNFYEFKQINLLGKPSLLMISRTSPGETPAIVRKHWKTISDGFDGDVIYVVEGVSSFNRKRFIEQRVPFIVPGNQLYIPMLGLDLREHFKQSKKPEKQWLSAAAQVLVLRELLGRAPQAMPAKELADLLGYSPMTLTRAINELVERDVATAEMIGREKRLEFTHHKQELWQLAKPYLRSPVKKQVWVVEHSANDLIKDAEAKFAGESALAEFTMIADPSNKILAVNASEWPGIKKLINIEECEVKDVDCMQIQLWRYSPASITNSTLVDPLSLWLSLNNTNDERIEISRDELLEKIGKQEQWEGV